MSKVPKHCGGYMKFDYSECRPTNVVEVWKCERCGKRKKIHKEITI